ncbi:hypothetical protein [Campylobacter troglodytis]|uniref:hypothetical protein n=1 Tax=Campylobacter troglodytis TaxID=654363 RepID=UPI00115AFEA7|nr:hypothetical protein [Campylobacter troglodytis]
MCKFLYLLWVSLPTLNPSTRQRACFWQILLRKMCQLSKITSKLKATDKSLASGLKIADKSHSHGFVGG